jgi:hypothetical protein
MAKCLARDPLPGQAALLTFPGLANGWLYSAMNGLPYSAMNVHNISVFPHDVSCALRRCHAVVVVGPLMHVTCP